MSKRCPSCGYGPIGPFTDNCPICAEPVRNVRSSGGGGGFRPSNLPPLWQWIIGGAIAIVVAFSVCCGITIWRFGKMADDVQKQIAEAKEAMEADRKARTVVVAAADLIQEFQKDPAAADKKYSGKYLEVTGVVERVGQERNQEAFVLVHAGDADAKVKIECYIGYEDPRDQVRLKRLEKGQKVTVRGEYGRQVSNVQLQQCTLIE